VLIYSSTITPRLNYIAEFSGKETIGKPFELTNDLGYFRQHKGFKINYSSGKIDGSEFWIKPWPLLFEEMIAEQAIQCFEEDGIKFFFKTEGDLPFDIFAASFYLLSRYEEYLPHKKDMYGRYAYENSLAFKAGFLNQPLINQWLQFFKKQLQHKFPSLTAPSPSFVFLPTYDIDIAWAFKSKGFLRTAGGFIRSIFKGKFRECTERIATLRGRDDDPFDTYQWLDQLHEKYQLKPNYFFLVAEKTGRYDKNVSPGKKALQQLVKDHIARYPVGIHPSWQSGDEKSLLKSEINTLEQLTGKKVDSSRQHYIRFTLPETFRRLIDHGIKFDFSMGYGSINGFRASVATPFNWYDLENEERSSLLLYPFCYMEANSFYEQLYTPSQARDELKHYYNVVKSVNGTLITIWHNHFLGTDKLFKGWKEVYEQFIDEIAK
jgi:uncharacterized protein DUF7033